MTLLDECVDTREEDRKERGGDRAPQCERDQAKAAPEAAAHDYSIPPKEGAAGRSDETKFRMTTYAAMPD